MPGNPQLLGMSSEHAVHGGRTAAKLGVQFPADFLSIADEVIKLFAVTS